MNVSFAQTNRACDKADIAPFIGMQSDTISAKTGLPRRGLFAWPCLQISEFEESQACLCFSVCHTNIARGRNLRCSAHCWTWDGYGNMNRKILRGCILRDLEDSYILCQGKRWNESWWIKMHVHSHRKKVIGRNPHFSLCCSSTYLRAQRCSLCRYWPISSTSSSLRYSWRTILPHWQSEGNLSIAAFPWFLVIWSVIDEVLLERKLLYPNKRLSTRRSPLTHSEAHEILNMGT